MIEFFITVWFGTGIAMDRTIVESMSKKVALDITKYTSCKNVVMKEVNMDEKEFDKKIVMYVCDFKTKQPNNR